MTDARRRTQRLFAPTFMATFIAMWFALAMCAAEPLFAAEPDFKDELPRIKQLSPAEAHEAFKLKPGYRIELAAAEPVVADPVAMHFDEDGRLFVVEMRGYPEHRDSHLGQVRMLIDEDDDGVFEKSTVYVEKLSWPTAVLCWDGGVFVGAAPDILYCKDTDGDGKADIRQRVFTGFGTQNVQGLLNCFRWSLDNTIHVAPSSNGGAITRVIDEWPIGSGNTLDNAKRPDGSPRRPVNVRGQDFRFDPRSLEYGVVSGGGQHGMCFDDFGRKFVCSNSDHLQMVVYELEYFRDNRFLKAPGPRRSIAADGPQAPVFRSSPVEPWRIVRTRLRVAGDVPGPVEGGGTPAGYFTGATGVTIYRGDAIPELHGLAIIGDVGSNIVHRKKLEANGVEFVGKRIDEESEFIASTDIWFRPAQFAHGPDGALYILDMHREVIEHPKSLPPMIKQHLDLTSGRGTGRIWRVTKLPHRRPADRERHGHQAVKLSEATNEALVALLADPNGWTRDTAARLLYQRNDEAATPLLRGHLRGLVEVDKNALKQADVLAALHALYALQGLGQLNESDVTLALGASDARLLENALQLAEHVDLQSPQVRLRMDGLADYTDPRVRFQLALTLGKRTDNPAREMLVKLFTEHIDDRWLRLAVLSGLGDDVAPFLDKAAAHLLVEPEHRALLEQLAEQVGRRNRRTEVATVLGLIARLSRDGTQSVGPLARGLTAGLRKSKDGAFSVADLKLSDQRELTGLLAEMTAEARRSAVDDEAPTPRRLEAIRTLAIDRTDDTVKVLASLLSPAQPAEVQHAAVKALDAIPLDSATAALIDAWPAAGPTTRTLLADALFTHSTRIKGLLDAIEARRLKAVDLGSLHRKLLVEHSDIGIRTRAARLLESTRIAGRQPVFEAFQPALKLTGDATRGKAIFTQRCATCHRVGDVGKEIGPSLPAFASRGAEAVLLNVIDPNREVNPQYVNYVVKTADGRVVTGMIQSETPTAITLLRANDDSETVLRADIESVRSTGLSLMPEQLEKELTHQATADLLAFVLQAAEKK